MSVHGCAEGGVRACSCARRMCASLHTHGACMQARTGVWWGCARTHTCKVPWVGHPRGCQCRSTVRPEAERPWEAGRLQSPWGGQGSGRTLRRAGQQAALTSERDAGVAAQVPLQLGIVHLLRGREGGGEGREDPPEVERVPWSRGGAESPALPRGCLAQSCQGWPEGPSEAGAGHHGGWVLLPAGLSAPLRGC